MRRKQIFGVQFYRQKPVGNYIADFYAPAVGLVIEVDGSHHFDAIQANHDQQRSEYLRQIGLKILRFDDRQVLTQTEAVIEEIGRSVNEKSLRWSLWAERNPSLPPFVKGRNKSPDRAAPIELAARFLSPLLIGSAHKRRRTPLAKGLKSPTIALPRLA